MSRSVILLSGGLDSAANLAICAVQDEPVLCLTADYGQRAAAREIEAARELSRYYGVEHRVLRIEWLGQLGGSSLTDVSREMPAPQSGTLDDLKSSLETAKAVWVPNRNGVLINAAAAFAESLGCAQVVVGFNREEAATFPDNSADFTARATRALELSTANHVRVACYTLMQDKREMVATLSKLEKPFPFDMTWSCYEGGLERCGVCESCQRFARAMGQTVKRSC
ncbi:MAG: 7-cyano-7-deazaguanine synthase QueC [Oligoflexia bacterium]|nr:7-cyano-7-deazaguanine synthase QueC [Oligoflexia bacterium]